MKNVPILIGTILATLGLVAGIVFFFSRATQPQQSVDPMSLIPAEPHVKGATESAQVTIVEFSDFQCPACRATKPLLDQVVAQYPDKVRLVYRHYPLSIHQYAELAARASEAADDDNKFWEYHDLLFERQDEWSSLGSQAEVQEKLAVYAEELGIDKASFLERIQSDRIKSLVTQDVAQGGQLNVQATPTLYVDGQPVSAPQLLSEVESRINNK